MAQLPTPEKIGLETVLGSRIAKGTTCHFDLIRPDGSITSYSYTGLVSEGEIISSTCSASGVCNTYANRVTVNEEGTGQSLSCPENFTSTVGLQTFAYITTGSGTSNENTGIYELEGLMFGFAALIILLALINAGIGLAKKGVKATHEETTVEDNIEYYEHANGKVYWRIKGRKRT